MYFTHFILKDHYYMCILQVCTSQLKEQIAVEVWYITLLLSKTYYSQFNWYNLWKNIGSAMQAMTQLWIIMPWSLLSFKCHMNASKDIKAIEIIKFLQDNNNDDNNLAISQWTFSSKQTSWNWELLPFGNNDMHGIFFYQYFT